MRPVPEDFSQRDLARIEVTTQEVGRTLFDHVRRRQPGVLERRWWDDRIMSWAMQDESVKVQMFRFVDVLPMLGSSESIVRHLREYFDEVRHHLPRAVRLGLAVATPQSIAGRALAAAARRNALGHARRFIAGTSVAEVLAAAMRERKLRRAFTIDSLGEAVISEVEADAYLDAYLHLIEGIAPTVNAWTEVPQIDRGELAVVPRVNVSVKLSALDSRFDALDPEGTTRRVLARLRSLLRTARRHGAHVHVDMESYQTKDLTLAIFRQVLMEDEFRDLADVGIVIQCYLLDALDDLERLAAWARQRGTGVWVRLVKGAYWDYETVHAQAQGWPVPVFTQKWQSDASFERCTRFLLQNHDVLHTALGSHNIRSLSHGIAVARHLGLAPTSFELQMLYGMGDQEKQALVDMGYRMRIYMPYGALIPGMAYLVRRLLENTSNDSFLRASFSSDVSPEILLMNPIDVPRSKEARPETGGWRLENDMNPIDVPRSSSSSKATPTGAATAARTNGGGQHRREPFSNEPHCDFAKEEPRRLMRQAVDLVRGRLGETIPLWIDGAAVGVDEHIESIDPSHHGRLVGRVCAGGGQHVQQAVGAARRALGDWNALGVRERAGWLSSAAQRMRRERYELAAWQVFECGKGWREADADVCEAIDFCEYYAREAVELMAPHGVDVPGEENEFVYLPRGVVAVISPWNFPLAILTGMTAAALVTGNTVIMKPAEQASVNAWRLNSIFSDLGLPPGVLNYLPGRGELVGAGLVEHPDTAVIAFTGSRSVGLAINRRAAEVSAAGSGQVKRVIAEMGGKNAIIVDDDADLDEAVAGVLKSAFFYQGQKCSACSRAIVLASVYDAFLGRLVEATRGLLVAPPEDPASNIGPVIDQEAFDRIHRYIELGKKEGRLVLAVDAGELAKQGYFIGPHIFADVPPTARLAQEEIFGPVLAVIRARDLDEAIGIANGTDYALTGGIFSRSPAHLDRARRELLVGNLYLNRGITGAMVNRQPFGGFRMSGIGSKAGGHDYLLQFVIPRTITENTLRRGFAPAARPEGGDSGM